MSLVAIPYVSLNVERFLWRSISSHSDRYATGDFKEILDAPGATLQMSQRYDPNPIRELDAARGDLFNSKLIWKSLKHLTPALARENRLWVRLCHAEALAYSRARWWRESSKGSIDDSVRAHAFARTRTQCRDDNALSRLWWTAYVAHRLMPEDFDTALAALFNKADTRAAIVERPWTGSRSPIGSSIIRALQSDPWLSDKESNLREVMKRLNVTAAGIAVEASGEGLAAALVQEAVDFAKQ
ncbi:TPA: hypothetical protein QDZ99_000755 [Stenotrophomonas maltophilia]|nr:hypothetical protein [Stenotrophomonas maltophilia]HDS1155578.1 hypothetical protein [Stenotrophomonas maltophilia]HDS1167097.1 hypothetical protein [Stenotrophomonas maltophilia]HDS1169084.1 hypothetical protein [Stenotrophomonas maltophilia]HDS1174458.1 hypothetical protein [Stenotrophomonas maltophilia]